MKIGIKFVLPYSQDKGDERLKQPICHLLKVRFGFLDEELSGIVEPVEKTCTKRATLSR